MSGRAGSPSFALALAGPLVAGAVLGVPGGLAAVGTRSVGLVALVLGVSALTAPALYVGATLLQVAPEAGSWVGAGRRALASQGILLLGLTGPLLFLLATSSDPGGLVPLLGALAVGGAGLAAMRALFQRVFPARPLRSVVLFTAWGLIASAIGRHLLLKLLEA